MSGTDQKVVAQRPTLTMDRRAVGPGQHPAVVHRHSTVVLLVPNQVVIQSVQGLQDQWLMCLVLAGRGAGQGFTNVMPSDGLNPGHTQ